jgi:hypothetical protein
MPNDMNMVINPQNHNFNPGTYQYNSMPVFESQEPLNISYNFSNISQMNININISNYKNENKQESEDYLRRKRGSSPKSYYNMDSDNEKNKGFYKKYSKEDSFFKKRFHQIKYSRSKSRSPSKYKRSKRRYSYSKSKSEEKDRNESPGNNITNISTMDKPTYMKRSIKKYSDKYRRNVNFYKPGFRNFDDNFNRKPYFPKTYKPYHKSTYKKRYSSFRSSSQSSSRSNSKLKEFLNLRNTEEYDEDTEEEENNNIIELKSNLKKP